MPDAMKINQSIMDSIESMFYTPNYCDLYMHVNQVRELLGFDKSLIDVVVEENKWVIEQFRKYVGSRRALIMKHAELPSMLDEVENMIEKAEEANRSPKELLYMYLRDEWMAQMHAAVSNAIDALQHVDEEEDYDA